jgi:hypothetical protein
VVQKRVQSLFVELLIPDDELERKHGREASVLQLTLEGLLDEVVGLSDGSHSETNGRAPPEDPHQRSRVRIKHTPADADVRDRLLSD